MKKLFYSIILAMLCFAVIHAASARPQAREGTAVSKDGTQISFSVYGKGEPTLVFIHGWSCNRSVWAGQVPYFSKNHRVVTLDLAGHGSSVSEREVFTVEAFGEDVAAVIREIKAPKVILIGHSMAGEIILETAQIVPDSILALVGIDTLQDMSAAFTPTQVEENMKPFRHNFAKTKETFIRSLFIEGTDPAFIRKILGMMSEVPPEVGISAMEEMFKTSHTVHSLKVSVPVWCLNSEIWPTRSEVNRKYLPYFNLRLMPNVGHFLMMEKPAEFNRQLEAILKEIG